VIEPGAEPAFFLEPQNPADWPDHFIQDGFTIMARYDSRLDDNLRQLPDLGRVASRLAQLGFTIRPFRADRITQELALIFDLSLASFRQNFLYTPISLAEFMAIYAPLQPYIQPELIFIAEHNGMAIGFIFALPDVLQAQRNETTDTVIIKTVAVHPQYRIGGIGSLLVTRCRETACRLGYRRAIHALMFEGNVSRKMSRRNQSTLLRRYALFSKGL